MAPSFQKCQFHQDGGARQPNAKDSQAGTKTITAEQTGLQPCQGGPTAQRTSPAADYRQIITSGGSSCSQWLTAGGMKVCRLLALH